MFNMMGNYGENYYDYGMGWFGFGFMHIFGILFWISVIVAVIVVIKHFFDKTCPWHKGGGAVEILKERYAKGEITKSQYEEMKKELSD